jgi:hypothetical protein
MQVLGVGRSSFVVRCTERKGRLISFPNKEHRTTNYEQKPPSEHSPPQVVTHISY